MSQATSSRSCSCCESTHEERAFLLPLKLVVAPYQDVRLCDVCIETCNEILAEEGIATDAVAAPSPVRIHTPRPPFHHHHCSFCGRAEAQVMRLIALLGDLRICNLCVGACNAAAAMPDKEKTQLTERERTVEQPTSDTAVTILRELDLGAHTLFLMSDGSIDLIANDEQAAYVEDNCTRLDGDEAYRLYVALHEQFKQRVRGQDQGREALCGHPPSPCP